MLPFSTLKKHKEAVQENIAYSEPAMRHYICTAKYAGL